MCWGYRGDKKPQNHERSFRECWTRSYELQRHQHVSLGVASCQSAILSLKKAVWRLWLVSKSRTKSSAEGCEQLLRRAASVARPPSSPSHARAARRRLQATREIPPAIRHRRSAQGFFLRSSLSIRAARARHLSRAASLAVFSSNVSWRGRTNLRSSPIPVGSSSMMGFPVHGLNGQ